MRITVVTESFYPATDGATTTVRHLLDRLVDRGHRVHLIAPGPGIASYRGVPITRVRPLEKPGRQVRAAIEASAPDLVHVTSCLDASAPEAALRGGPSIARKALKHARAAGVPSLVVQQAPVADLATARWQTTIADRADRVLVTAHWMRERLAALGVGAETWLPGVDAHAFGPALRDEHLHGTWAARKSGRPRVVVGFVGALERRHGVRHLVDVARHPEVRLVAIGRGGQAERLRSRLDDAATARPRLLGPLGSGDLATAMASLDVLVHPGTRLTCAHALREAAASGVPVVAPRAGAAREVVAHLETGLLYDPEGREGLRRAVDAVVADRHRALLGRHARGIAEQRDWRSAVDELVERHYRALVPSGAGAAAAGAPRVPVG